MPGQHGYRCVATQLQEDLDAMHATTHLITSLTLPLILLFLSYFGAAKDLPGVRELFEEQRMFLAHGGNCSVLQALQ